jgi:pilus assembly protein CpaB
MNKNVLIAFGGATLIALVVAMMMSAMLKGGREKDKKPVEVAQVQIMVATAPIKTGEMLSDKNVKWQTWPESATFPGVIRRVDKQKLADAANGRAIRPIAANEPVVSNAIVKGDGNFMAAMLTPGKRAMAIKVAAHTMAGGFINPGDYVDVLLTYRARYEVKASDKDVQANLEAIFNDELDKQATEIVLQNIRVLAIDQRASKSEESTSAKVGKTITLEVDDRQMEILALANEIGDLSLALRSLGDDHIIDLSARPTVSDSRLLRLRQELSAMRNRMLAENMSYVRVYTGGTVMNIPTR